MMKNLLLASALATSLALPVGWTGSAQTDEAQEKEVSEDTDAGPARHKASSVGYLAAVLGGIVVGGLGMWKYKQPNYAVLCAKINKILELETLEDAQRQIDHSTDSGVTNDMREAAVVQYRLLEGQVAVLKEELKMLGFESVLDDDDVWFTGVVPVTQEP